MRTNSNFLAVDSGVFGPGIWIVGDSVFPGQGTMATVLSAIRIVERMTGVSWASLRRNSFQGKGAGRVSSVDEDNRPLAVREDGLVSRRETI